MSAQRSGLPRVFRARVLKVSPSPLMWKFITGPGVGARGGSPATGGASGLVVGIFTASAGGGSGLLGGAGGGAGGAGGGPAPAGGGDPGSDGAGTLGAAGGADGTAGAGTAAEPTVAEAGIRMGRGS